MGAIKVQRSDAGTQVVLPGGVRVRASDDPDSPLLNRFFEGYDRAFVLPDEREELGVARLSRSEPHSSARLWPNQSEQIAVTRTLSRAIKSLEDHARDLQRRHQKQVEDRHAS